VSRGFSPRIAACTDAAIFASLPPLVIGRTGLFFPIDRRALHLTAFAPEQGCDTSRNTFTFAIVSASRGGPVCAINRERIR